MVFLCVVSFSYAVVQPYQSTLQTTQFHLILRANTIMTTATPKAVVITHSHRAIWVVHTIRRRLCRPFFAQDSLVMLLWNFSLSWLGAHIRAAQPALMLIPTLVRCAPFQRFQTHLIFCSP